MKKKQDRIDEAKLIEFRRYISSLPRDWIERSKDGRAAYHNHDRHFGGHTNHVSSGFGKWINLPFMTIGLDILNNIPTVAYNYDYGCHEPISPVSLLVSRGNIYEAIDIVLRSFQLKMGRPPVEFNLEKEAIVTNERELAKEIFQDKHKVLHVVVPRNRVNAREPSIYELALHYERMNLYLNNVIRRYLYIRAYNITLDFFNTLINGRQRITP